MKEQRDLSKDAESGVGNKIAHTTTKGIYFLSEGLLWLGCFALFVIMILTVFDVFGRYFFKSPIPGTIEIVQLIMCVGAFCGMIYCTARGGHIGVRIITDRLPWRVQRILVSVMHFIGAGAFAFVSWQLWSSAVGWIERGYTAPTTAQLLIPLVPFKFFAAVGAGLVALMLFRSFIQSLGKQT